MMTSAPETTASNLESAPRSLVLSIIPTVYHGPSLLTLRWLLIKWLKASLKLVGSVTTFGGAEMNLSLMADAFRSGC